MNLRVFYVAQDNPTYPNNPLMPPKIKLLQRAEFLDHKCFLVWSSLPRSSFCCPVLMCFKSSQRALASETRRCVLFKQRSDLQLLHFINIVCEVGTFGSKWVNKRLEIVRQYGRVSRAIARRWNVNEIKLTEHWPDPSDC